MYKRLTIGGEECDLQEGAFPFSISYKISKGGFIAASNAKRSVVLPATANNDAIFDDWGNPSAIVTDNAELRPFRYEQGGVVLFAGQAELVSAPLQGDRYRYRAKEYKVDLYGDNADWALLLAETKLRDFPYTNHIYNQSTVMLGWYASYPTNESGFTVVKWHEWATSGQVAIDELTPFIFIRAILEKAFTSIGYKLTSSFLDSAAFKKLIHLAPLPERYPQEFSDDYLNIEASIVSGPIPYGGGALLDVNFLAQTTTPSVINPFNTTNSHYTVPYDGYYEITINASVYNYSGPGTYSFLCSCLLNGTPLPDTAIGAFGGYSSNQDFTRVSNVLQLSAGDVIRFTHGNSPGTGVSYDYDLSYKIVGEAELKFGVPIIYKYLLRDWKVLPMIRDLQRMFNLRFETNAVTKEVVVEPADSYLYQDNATALELRDGFYQSTGDDNTQELDLSRGGELYNEINQARFTVLQYKTEGATEETIDLNQDLGFFAGRYTLPADRFNESTETVELEYFAKTLNELDRDISATTTELTVNVPLIYPQDYFENPTATAAQANYEVEARILYFAGIRTGQPKINFTSLGALDYPQSFMVNYQDATDFSLSFGTETINGIEVPGLLRAFHLQDFARKRLGKRLEVYKFWELLDIVNLTFRDKLYIDGREYVLSEINGFRPMQETPTKTILQLDQVPESDDVTAISSSKVEGLAKLIS